MKKLLSRIIQEPRNDDLINDFSCDSCESLANIKNKNVKSLSSQFLKVFISNQKKFFRSPQQGYSINVRHKFTMKINDENHP